MEPPLATVDRAIDLLFHLHGAAAPCGVTAIARDLALPKSSVHRLLSALRRRRLVEQDAQGRYRAGIGLVALGLGALEREPVVAAARPVLERQAESIGETFFLVASRGGELVVLDKAEGTGFLRAAPRVGSSVPAHATAVGKLYLAFAPDALAAGPRSAKLGEAFTNATLTDTNSLARDVDAARRRGWAANRDEWIEGLSVLAAPVFRAGQLAGAVALAGASARIEVLGVDALAERVLKAADEIGRRLEGQEPADAGASRRAGNGTRNTGTEEAR